MYLPNIRRMFIPDKGCTIVDADLSGADAQVVAWEADDEDLKSAFRKGIKIHVHNARSMWPHETKDLEDDEIKKAPIYKQVKAGCHAVNYGATPPALVFNNGWDMAFAEEFRERWFQLHPKIKEWHERTENFLSGTQCWNCHAVNVNLTARCDKCGVALGRTVKNQFGFRRIYFDRVDGLLNAALAWVPQSTVAFCVEIGWTAIAHGPRFSMMRGHGPRYQVDWSRYLVDPTCEQYRNMVQFLIQVHDSTVFQLPTHQENLIEKVVKSMAVRVPYADPLIIPMAFKHSRESWGDAE